MANGDPKDPILEDMIGEKNARTALRHIDEKKGISYLTSNIDLSHMNSEEVAAHIDKKTAEGDFEAADQAFYAWGTQNQEALLNESGESAQLNAAQASEALKVVEARQRSQRAKAKFDKEKSQNPAPDTKQSKTPKGTDNKPPKTSTSKKALDDKSANQAALEKLSMLSEEDKSKFAGICGNPLLLDPNPTYIKVDDDTVLPEGKHNAKIILGRDRFASRCSGYGGKGHTQAGAIDIVAGYMGYKVKEYQTDDPEEQKKVKILANPDFVHDAARIYISQKADIDDYFNLAGHRSTTRSAIGMKADAVRIIARDGIKLVTRTDRINSLGGDISDINGIDLIATNDDSDLQPIPKGENLAEGLKKLTDFVVKLNGIVDRLLEAQTNLNEKLTNHYHYAPAQVITFPGGIIWKTTPSPPVVAAGIKCMVDHLSQCKRSLFTHQADLTKFKSNYFMPWGEKYINSRYNNTT